MWNTASGKMTSGAEVKGRSHPGAVADQGSGRGNSISREATRARKDVSDIGVG